jgi:formylmethanofuran--tetrahydromethanopterin N-formyltransferase
MEVNGVEVEDTYAEAFDGLMARMIVTAKTEKLLMKAANSTTALPCTVFGEAEGGIEKILDPSETPDGRPGAIIQLWVNYGSKSMEQIEYELGKRIRQGTLVVPTTRVFNALGPDEQDSRLKTEDFVDMMCKVGYCGDGYQKVINEFEREMIAVPLMMGDFLIEKKLGVKKGVMGGNVWFFCDSEDSALAAGEAGVDAIKNVEGAITSFDVCSAGSKVGGQYPEIGPTTNHPFCPTCKVELASESEVPEGIASIPEIVIDGVNVEAVKEAMRVAIQEGSKVKGVKKISAGNFGGKLGKHHIHLKDLI